MPQRKLFKRVETLNAENEIITEPSTITSFSTHEYRKSVDLIKKS